MVWRWAVGRVEPCLPFVGLGVAEWAIPNLPR
jgi:hypothetical protein